MNKASIMKACAEAERFLGRVSELRVAELKYLTENGGEHCHMPKEMGAVRRASLDLTRALADMRRPS